MPVSSSASASSRTPMSYDRFMPKFPLDPFAGAEQSCSNSPNARAPWTLDADALPPPSILQHERRVILAIGQASGAALAPLFASPHLVSSLLIIASHRPPALPFDTCPSVYTLRLRTPLAVADAGATRLIEVLEWALQIAQLWRRSGGPKKQELMEEVSPSSQSVPLGRSFGRLRYSVAPDSQQDQMNNASAFSPGASTTSLTQPSVKKSRRKSLFKRASSIPLVADPASMKPFDALLHFLPADASDKSRLKAAILVTTLTRPYLAVPPTRAASTRFYSEITPKLSSAMSSSSSSKSRGKRWSFFRSSSGATTTAGASSSVASPGSSGSSTTVLSQSVSTTDLSDLSHSQSVRSSLTNLALLRARRSRLVHLMPSGPAPINIQGTNIKTTSSVPRPRLPTGVGGGRTGNYSNLLIHSHSHSQAQAHLVRSIEAFLLSFCFSGGPDLLVPIAGFAAASGSGSGSAAGDAESAAAAATLKARPYVMPAMALTGVLRLPADSEEEQKEEDDDGESSKKRNEWTLAELVLSGALESEAESTPNLRSGSGSGFGNMDNARRNSSEIPGAKGKEKQFRTDHGNGYENSEWMTHRAWIGGVRDIVVVRSTSLKGVEKAHIPPTRSSSQPLLPSQTQTHTHPRSISISSPQSARPHAQSRSQPISNVELAQYPYPAYLSQGQDHPMRSPDARAHPNASGRNPKAVVALYVDTSAARKDRRSPKKSGYQSLAIEKRLPTPPEDENENENADEENEGVEDQEVKQVMDGEADEGDSMVSNATSCTRSPRSPCLLDEDEGLEDEEEMSTPGGSGGESAEYGGASMPSRRRFEYLKSAYDSSQHERQQSRDGYARPYEQGDLPSLSLSISRTASTTASPYSSPISASSSTPTSTVYTSIPPIRPSTSRRHPDWHQSVQYQYKPPRSSSRWYEAYRAVDENGYEYQTDKQCVTATTGSLPTPPDSEEASVEGASGAADTMGTVIVTPPAAVAIAPLPSRERDHGYAAVGRTSPLQRRNSRVQDERRREWTRETSRDVETRRREDSDRERERRRRTYSQPSHPTARSIIEDRIPPRRSKTKPKDTDKEKPTDRPPSRQQTTPTTGMTLEKRPSPTTGESKSKSKSNAEKSPLSARPEMQRTHSSRSSQSQSQRKLSKNPSRPEMARNASSDERERDPARRTKRVSVPTLKDVLPPLPRPPAPRRPPPPPPEWSSRGRYELNEKDESGKRYERGGSNHEKNHGKWKFWKPGTGPVVNA